MCVDIIIILHTSYKVYRYTMRHLIVDPQKKLYFNWVEGCIYVSIASQLFQIMFYHPLGPKLLFEPMLIYSQMDHEEQNEILIETRKFSFTTMCFKESVILYRT